MRVMVNLPELDAEKQELESRVAYFHATLLIETIKQLNIDDESKEKVLDSVLEHIKLDIRKEQIEETVWNMIDSFFVLVNSKKSSKNTVKKALNVV